jgi:DNA-directed RNA polymerase subunit K/omega
VIFRRATQLRSGARPRVDATGHTLLRVALLEVMAGTIPWQTGSDRAEDLES